MVRVEELYNIHYEDMVRYVSRSFRMDESYAHDIVQDAFIKILRKHDLNSQKKSFKSWILIVVKNTTLDYLRKNREILGIEYENFLKSDEVEEIEDENNISLNKYLSQLPEKQRTAIEMYYYDNMTHDAIASKLNITSGTSKSNLHRAKYNLKKLMENV